MKRRLMRPTAALFPAVLLFSALTADQYMAENLFFYWIVLQFCSLCSVDAFRNAAAREPGVRRVDRRFSGTWPMILLGTALMMVLMRYIAGSWPFDPKLIALPISVAFITIEQLFEERMFALSRNADGVVLSIISNLLLLLGLHLDASGGVAAPMNIAGFYTLCGSGLGMMISLATSYAVESMHGFSLKPVNIGFFHRAALQTLLYPALIIGAAVSGIGGKILDDMLYVPMMAGMMIWRISRTVCRRANDESRPLNLLLMAACAAVMIAAIWVPAVQEYIPAVVAAMICSVAVYCAPGWRIYAGAGLICAAWFLQVYIRLDIAAIVCCAAAVVLNLHKAFLKKV